MPRGKPNNPETAEKPGPNPKPEGTTVVRRNLSLYPWEWKEFCHGSEGPTDAARRILAERREQ